MIVLQTERLLFRSHRPEDLDAFCAIEADPDVRRFVGGQPRTREAAVRKFRRHLGRSTSRLRLWATVLKETNGYIGYCGVYPRFGTAGPIRGEGSLGFTLARAYWGRGLGTEAARAFLDYGFLELKLHRIVASVQVGNMASTRILEKLGFCLWRLERVNARCFLHLERRSDPVTHSIAAGSEVRWS
ncbi:MAG TPA: GNAT family N-acetyltransferase [Thermoanaerobaculia bacterium]|nr:GNAT family N-acetyltransferase [Thermoanaerobaculia bacterium]